MDFEFGDFERVTLAIAAHEDTEVRYATSTASEFFLKRTLGNVSIVVLRGPATAREGLDVKFREILKSAKVPLDLVVVGGDETVKEAMKKARPAFSTQRIGLMHIGADRGVWSKRCSVAASFILPLEEKVLDPQHSEAAWQRLAEAAQQFLVEATAQAEDMQTFGKTIAQRIPIATMSLIAICALIFVAEKWLGGPELRVVLVRMGALSPRLVAQGEWWRVVSCMFLHGDWVHLGLNSYVLWILGSFLERIVGPARFLIIYTVSGIVGSIGSVLMLDTAGLSVGASGAIWGLLGAHAVLAYHADHLLPKAMVPGARKAAVINLGINIMISFRPNIDMWAHFAGGTAGGLLLLSGLLTRGLPKFQRATSEPDAAPISPEIPVSSGLRGIAALCAGVLIAGVLLAAVNGRALELKSPMTLVTRFYPALELELDVPSGLETKLETGLSTSTVQLGDLGVDPAMVLIRKFKLAPGEDIKLIDELFNEPGLPPGAKAEAPPTRFMVGDVPGVAQSFVLESGLHQEQAVIAAGRDGLHILVYRWPRFEHIVPAGFAKKMALSRKLKSKSP